MAGDMIDLESRVAAALGRRYRLERRLGEGGMATVFLAEDLKLHRRVAVKVMKPEVSQASGPDRFLREIEIVAHLSHPHILQLHDSGHRDGLLYYVMPHVEGESLRERLDRERQLPVDEAVRIAREVADALQHAHSHGVIHRDIKPSNILLSEGHALVADFGVARALHETGDRWATATGLAVGTPAYMSPEQATGAMTIDARSDLYALGCVLFEMLAGQPPFIGPTPQAVLAKHATEPPPPLRMRRGVPEPVERTVRVALEKLPADRFASGADFARALAGVDTTGSSVVRRGFGRGAPGLSWAFLGLVGAALVIALVVLLPDAWVGGPREGTGDPSRAALQADLARLKRVAVLFFDPVDGDPDLSGCADELTRGLIEDFTQVGALEASSFAAVSSFRGIPLPYDSIALRLNVGLLVHGDVSRGADSIRVRTELIDGLTGTALWSEQLTERAGYGGAEPLAPRFVERLTTDLRQRIGTMIREKEWLLETASEDARSAVRAAQNHRAAATRLVAAGRTDEAADELGVADSLLAEASRHDRAWIEPYVRRAMLSEVAVLEFGLSPGSSRQTLRRALEEGVRHADQALGVSPRSAPALEVRCHLIHRILSLAPPEDPGEYLSLRERGRGDCSRAVALDPLLALAQGLLARFHFDRGSWELARRSAERAYREETSSSKRSEHVTTLAMASLELEEDREAMRWCREGARRYGESAFFARCELTVLAFGKEVLPDPDAAWELVARIVTPQEGPGGVATAHLLAASVLARAGQVDSARAVIDRERGAARPEPDVLPWSAAALARVGMTEEALDDLDRYLEVRPVSGRELLPRRMFQPLRGQAAFEAMMADRR